MDADFVYNNASMTRAVFRDMTNYIPYIYIYIYTFSHKDIYINHWLYNHITDKVIQGLTLGFSYRASSIFVTIRITNRCDFLYYVFISFFSSFPYMFRAFMSPSSGVLQAVVFMLPFGSLQYKTFKDFKLCCVRSELFMYIGVCCIVIYCLSC